MLCMVSGVPHHQKRRQRVNYFDHLGAECHFLKIGYGEFNFTTPRGSRFNLP